MASRIRIEVKKSGKVVCTKNTIVAAVRNLSQDSTVELTCSTQQLANWVYEHLSMQYVQGVIRSSITWVADPVKTIYDVVPSYKSTVYFDFRISAEEYENSEVLTIVFADLIKRTPYVIVKSKTIDDFI